MAALFYGAGNGVVCCMWDIYSLNIGGMFVGVGVGELGLGYKGVPSTMFLTGGGTVS